ncbi:MAG: M1 family metallopeptidase [Terriglobia bacterium]
MVSVPRLLFPLVLGAVLLSVAPAPATAQADLAALWSALAQPAFDPNQVAVAGNVELRRDAATLTLINGRLALSQALGPPGSERVVAAAFKGSGCLRFAPTLPLEKQQLAFHSGQEVLEAEFTEAVLLFTDNTLEELAAQVNFGSGDPSELQKLYRSRNKYWTKYGLNWEPRLLKALLADRPERHALFVAELKTRKHGWLTLVVDATDPEDVALFRFEPRRAFTVWSSFPSGGRRPQEVFADPLAHHEYLIRSYRLDVTVEKNTKLEAEAEVKLEMRHDGERVLLFDLDPNLRVSEVTNAAGQPLVFFQPRDPKDDYFLGDYLVVVAPEAFPLGPNALRVRYAGKRVVRKMGGGNFFCQSFGWYPTYGADEFAARVDFDLTLRVPKKYEAVATGQKVEDYKQDKYRITRWKSGLPLAVAGFAFGDYKVFTETVGDTQVEIYANKNPDDMLSFFERVARSPGTILIDPSDPSGRDPTVMSGEGPKAPMMVLGSLAPGRLAKVMASEVGNSLRLMEEYFGPYPYKKLAVTNLPGSYSYGQGWPSLLYVWAISFLDSTQRQQLGITDHVRLTDFFRAHETSHQWWGHAVGWKSYHDQWLSEGFAEFSGMLYAQKRRNPGEYFRLLRENRDSLRVRDPGGAVYEQIGPIYAGIRLSSADHPGGYNQVVYAKGGWVLHMLQQMLYDPRNREQPDHRFIAMMQEFTKTYFNQPASTEDFKRIVEKHMTPQMDLDGNRRMDWFFNQWVYGTGIPHYDFSYSIVPQPDSNTFLLKGRLRQRRVPDSFKMPVPVYLHQGKKMFRAGWIVTTGPETPFEVRLPFKPDKVTINEWEDILCTMSHK